MTFTEQTITETTESDNFELPSIIRTYKQGAFELYDGPWGSYLVPAIDPEANVSEITKEHLDMFELRSDINRIPSDLWSPWIKLCFYFAETINSNVEVSVRILRSQKDETKYRMVLPLQEVGGGSVRAGNFQKSIDIVSGEVLESYPPADWTPVGSSHSHNTMQAFFSSVDDKFEIPDPGIHIVVGSINHKRDDYALVASVTGNNRRFKVDEDKVIDLEPNDEITYHPKVLEYVSTQFGSFFKTDKKPSVLGFISGAKESKRNKNAEPWNFSSKKWYEIDRDKWGTFNDPFFYSSNGFIDNDGSEINDTESVDLAEIEDLLYTYIQNNTSNAKELVKFSKILEESTELCTEYLHSITEFFNNN